MSSLLSMFYVQPISKCTVYTQHHLILQAAMVDILSLTKKTSQKKEFIHREKHY